MTAREDAEILLRRFNTSGLPAMLNLRFVVDAGPVSRGKPVRCLAIMTLLDSNVRDRAEPFETQNLFHLHWGDDAATMRSLALALSDRLLHEMCEGIWMGDARPLNPHDPTSAWRPFRATLNP